MVYKQSPFPMASGTSRHASALKQVQHPGKKKPIAQKTKPYTEEELEQMKEEEIGVHEKVTEGTVKSQDALRKKNCKESGGTWNDKTKSCDPL
jgi:hypothetical protein|tara:strand:- start:161 stop:439 length:279 start_codon:yes stop_codon:yes gene_type:complete